MLRIFICFFLSSWFFAGAAQTIKTNLLAPASFYYEHKTGWKKTLQLGISYVPDQLNIYNYNDLSFVFEYRNFPKFKRLYPLEMNKTYPSGPFLAPYLKISNLSRPGSASLNTAYFGLVAGRKYMTRFGKRRWVFEAFSGIGLGTQLFNPNKSDYTREALDVRFGVCIGKHYRPDKKSDQKKT